MSGAESPSTSRLLALAGLVALAASHLTLLNTPHAAPGATISVLGVAAGYLLLGAGLWRLRDPAPYEPDAVRGEAVPPCLAPVAPAVGSADVCALGIAASFEAWLAEQNEAAPAWRAFEHWVQDVLSEHGAAVRTRCLAITGGASELRPLGEGGAAPDGLCTDEILKHVAATGREFVRAAPGCAPLLDELGQGGGPRWDWVWRVGAHDGTPLGVVAATLPSGKAAPDSPWREVVRAMVGMCWRQVAALESLRIASRTDQASGVMTRADFLEVAEAVVERCRKEREPVVLVAMALEGLRKLDDAGAWAERDALVAGVGQAISKRTRGDDLLGRFSDQSFVVLLRRMDVGLGRLIAEKLLAAGEACATHALGPVNELRFRVGVAGGALESLPLRGLLATALGALEQARRESLPLACAEKTGQRPVPQGPTDHRPVP